MWLFENGTATFAFPRWIWILLLAILALEAYGGIHYLVKDISWLIKWFSK